MKRPDLLRGLPSPEMPRQRRSRLRREAILQAALVRFGRDGYERASIRGIAEGAGVATGAVYQFFASKRHLLLVAMDALLRRLETLGPPSFTGPEALAADMERFLTDVLARERPFVGVYRAWQEAALVDSSIVAYDRQIRAWSSARVAGLFAVLSRLPGARADLDREALARLWDGFFWNLLAHPPSNQRRAIASLAAALLHCLFVDTAA